MPIPTFLIGVSRRYKTGWLAATVSARCRPTVTGYPAAA
jgi:hypothetical protein